MKTDNIVFGVSLVLIAFGVLFFAGFGIETTGVAYYPPQVLTEQAVLESIRESPDSFNTVVESRSTNLEFEAARRLSVDLGIGRIRYAEEVKDLDQNLIILATLNSNDLKEFFELEWHVAKGQAVTKVYDNGDGIQLVIVGYDDEALLDKINEITN